ncbi:hypothetical protein CEUSTIGMA_g4587.t1 [Chlamydomonas eustigma]|uniref:WH2 domain-containing protein n=1 Tax=Chlamydomonas eustigma TaxID=1157962 RepID=A0A250X244_9CHLO|nr:hypothetical protein CEUSTIGMA_g4587.t1 [Chlamydomonas eustigma]|eukprot:GAX77141.1 hypothetical protein CEUSTIGMA_g4587.t1 [Chlamydomonas eustigma]
MKRVTIGLDFGNFSTVPVIKNGKMMHLLSKDGSDESKGYDTAVYTSPDSRFECTPEKVPPNMGWVKVVCFKPILDAENIKEVPSNISNHLKALGIHLVDDTSTRSVKMEIIEKEQEHIVTRVCPWEATRAFMKYIKSEVLTRANNISKLLHKAETQVHVVTAMPSSTKKSTREKLQELLQSVWNARNVKVEVIFEPFAAVLGLLYGASPCPLPEICTGCRQLVLIIDVGHVTAHLEIVSLNMVEGRMCARVVLSSKSSDAGSFNQSAAVLKAIKEKFKLKPTSLSLLLQQTGTRTTSVNRSRQPLNEALDEQSASLFDAVPESEINIIKERLSQFLSDVQDEGEEDEVFSLNTSITGARKFCRIVEEWKNQLFTAGLETQWEASIQMSVQEVKAAFSEGSKTLEEFLESVKEERYATLQAFQGCASHLIQCNMGGGIKAYGVNDLIHSMLTPTPAFLSTEQGMSQHIRQVADGCVVYGENNNVESRQGLRAAVGIVTNDPGNDDKAMFELGLLYVEDGETLSRVHRLTPDGSLGGVLPCQLVSTKTLVTHGVQKLRGDEMSEEDKQMGLRYYMEVELVESEVPLVEGMLEEELQYAPRKLSYKVKCATKREGISFTIEGCMTSDKVILTMKAGGSETEVQHRLAAAAEFGISGLAKNNAARSLARPKVKGPAAAVPPTVWASGHHAGLPMQGECRGSEHQVKKRPADQIRSDGDRMMLTQEQGESATRVTRSRIMTAAAGHTSPLGGMPVHQHAAAGAATINVDVLLQAADCLGSQ